MSAKQVFDWKLVFDANGGVDVAASNALLDQREKNPGGPREPSTASAVPPLMASRRRKEAALATRRELELAQLQGEWIKVVDAKAVWARVALAIRNAFLGLPSVAFMNLALTKKQTQGLTILVRDILTRTAHGEHPHVSSEEDGG